MSFKENYQFLPGLCLCGFDEYSCMVSKCGKCALDFTKKEVDEWKETHKDGSLGCIDKKALIEEAIRKDKETGNNKELEKLFRVYAIEYSVCKCGHLAIANGQHTLCVFSRLQIPFPLELPEPTDVDCKFCREHALDTKLMINNKFIAPSLLERIKLFLGYKR